MQSAGLNLLTAIASNKPTPASEKTAEDVLSDGSSPNQQFAQLLAPQLVEEEPGVLREKLTNLPHILLNDVSPASSAASIAAQEVGANAAVTTAAGALAAQLQQPITPALATDLLKRVETVIAQLGDKGADGRSWQKLKEQLTEIQSSNTPKPLGELIEALETAPKDVVSVAVLAAAKEKSAERPASVDRAIRWLQAAFTRTTTKETPQARAPEEDAKHRLENPSALSLQAVTFRPSTDADAADAANPRRESEEGRDYVEITPLANTQIIPLPEWATALSATPVANTNVPTGEIASAPLVANDNTTRMTIDTLIPPLKLEADASLPKVDLPDVALPKTAGMTEKQAAAVSFAEQLNTATQSSTNVSAAGKTNAEMLLEGVSAKDAGAPAGNANAAITPTLNGQATPTQTATAVQPVNVHTGIGHVNHAPVSEQVHVAISRAKDDGLDRITIALEPAELGRVEVKMSVDRQGQTQISFMVDKAETFDALSRDARGLERALQESGIKADTGSMQFNLRQQAQPQLNSNLNGQGQPQQQVLLEEADETKTPVAAIAAAATRNYTVSVRDGVDIHA